MALDYRKYSRGAYAGEEKARDANRGLWSGAFEPSCEWRHARNMGNRKR
jgi:endonuclease YncB( thermonuclease family)